MVAGLVLGHADPPNLLDYDCMAGDLAVKMAARNYPRDPSSAAAFTHRALNMNRCPGVLARPSFVDMGWRPMVPHQSATVELFVSPTGNDATGNGSLPSPFATIARARDEIRKTPVASRGRTTVYLRAGTYYQSSTLEFGPEDSGQSAALPILYTAYNNETVTVSGGMPLSVEWRPYGKAYTAKLPPGVPLNFTTLFVDNVRAIRARFPNGNPMDNSNLCFAKIQDPTVEFPSAGHVLSGQSTGTVSFPKAISFKVSSNVTQYGAYPTFDGMASGFASQFDGPGGMCTFPNITGTECGSSTPCTVPCSIPGAVPWFAHYGRVQGSSSGFTYDPATWTPRRWMKPELGVIRAISPIGWGSSTFSIAAMNQDNYTFTLDKGGWQIADSKPFGGTPFYVEGIKEELDAPWEWVVDADEGVLYFFPNQTMPSPPPSPPPGPPPPGPSPPPAPMPPDAFVIASLSASATQCSLNHNRQGCCVDLQYYRRTPGSIFAADNCHPTDNGANQQFTYDNSTRLLKNELSGLCLGGDASSVMIHVCNSSSPQQQWTPERSSMRNGVGCLGSKSSQLKDGTALAIFPCDGSPAQQWALSKCATPSCLPPALAGQGVVEDVVPPPTLTEAVLLDTVVRFGGVDEAYVKNVGFSGVRFAHAATTQLRRYEVPSGGDWSVFRGGAVEIENAEGIAITDSFFDSVGGNAVLLSRHALNCTVTRNRVSFPGDSGVVLLGISNMADGTAPTFPMGNLIENNFVHDIGSFGKEVSCYFQAVAGGNTVRGNICLNGPRAGFNFNDGFMGGTIVDGNLIANMVRETHDHGPINSWNRNPYATRHANGSIVSTPEWNHILRNLVINGYQGVWALDHDDGSSYYNDTGNVLFYGGCKNFQGNNKRCGPDNLIVMPGIASRSSGDRSCQTNDNKGFSYNEYIGNDCITQDGQPYTFSGFPLDPTQVPLTANNRFYSPNASFDYGGHNLTALQDVGLDKGSTVAAIPPLSTVAALAMAKLGLS